MKTQIQKQENVSHTIQSKTKAANQASIMQVLQKYKDKTAQREALPDEEELLQGKFDETVPNQTGIPDNMKSGFENMSGFSFDDVRVHYNSDKPAQLNALAYTQGNQVHIAPGQEKHLGHELGHVVQQKQGRVQPTMQLQGVNVNDDERLEREADNVGNMPMQMKTAVEVVQRFKCGCEPQNPNNYRNHTTIISDGSGVPDGGKEFNSSQRDAILSNNKENFNQQDQITVDAGNISDYSNSSLGIRTQISSIEPEVDHIVPKAANGANTYNNARVLSKTENTGITDRPGLDEIQITAFEGFNVKEYEYEYEDEDQPWQCISVYNYQAGEEIEVPYFMVQQIRNARYGTEIFFNDGTKIKFTSF
jgi:hypothetical protein